MPPVKCDIVRDCPLSFLIQAPLEHFQDQIIFATLPLSRTLTRKHVADIVRAYTL